MKLATLLAVARRFSGLVALATCVSAAVLVWVGYRSVREWEGAATAVALGRAQAAADLLGSAVTRDMRGLQQVVLATADRDAASNGQPIDLLPALGSAFARYPYPEAFFSWRADPAREPATFYTRVDRVPAWLSNDADRTLSPVVLSSEPRVAERLLARVKRDGQVCKRMSMFDTQIADVPYEVVAVISYGSSPCDRVTGVLGFLVNMNWVRQVYFRDLTDQMAHVDSSRSSARLLVLDDRDQPVVGTADDTKPAATLARRPFTLAFFDPLLVELDPPADLHIPTWTAAAVASDDPAVVATESAARKTLIVDAAMSFVLVMALLISARAARASADLAEMRSEFVSTVTHELKTPISNIRAINETLASGRGTEAMSREYPELALNEAKRLGRLIDNLLAYAKINDVTDAYAFESVSLEMVVRSTLAELRGQLSQAHFDVDIDMPPDLPDVRADLTALGLALSNIIDNAIRYSTDDRKLFIRAERRSDRVSLEVADTGVGIPADELSRVTRKFFRGRSSHSGGSGLGLAIVERIVNAHGGALNIRSEVGRGTAVSVVLPIWKHA